MCWSPQGVLLATGDLDGLVKLWTRDSNSDALVLIRTLVAHKEWVKGQAFTSESELISGSLNTIIVWNKDEYDVFYLKEEIKCSQAISTLKNINSTSFISGH